MHFSEKFKIAEKFAFFKCAETLFLHTFFQNALILGQNKILTSNQLQMATNFLNIWNKKGAFKFLQPSWSFKNSNTLVFDS